MYVVYFQKLTRTPEERMTSCMQDCISIWRRPETGDPLLADGRRNGS